MAGSTLHGVNLSGWLVPEPWVTPELFSGTRATSDDALFAAVGPKHYEELVRGHRATFVNAEDFQRMADRGYDAVRLQVPWYAFGEAGPDAEGRPGCVDSVDAAFGWAEDAGILVLIVISSVPGARLTADGLSLMLDPSFDWRPCLLDVVSALALRYGSSRALLGIEPIDQVLLRKRKAIIPPSYTEGADPSFLRNYYREAYRVVRRTAGSEPVFVVSDAGEHGIWRGFMSHGRYENVWLDAHLYHHTDVISGTGPSGVRYLADQSKKALEVERRCGLPVMVGEWSSAMPVAGPTVTPEGRLALSRIYTSSQLAAFEGCPAWFYQTWKTSTRDLDWDARIALSSFDRDMLD
ncbi:MAG: glucan 1,3-beta-glucosidase [Atopobiaceae bacterium]|nr:glucan 1,3-beta-glucosidase [Atopobiaceae bacterium]MCI1318835.1 glucan 1,3-beta-glucosidase [Atopobiaceae bacterium]MCI1389739.1 glucan 1,3-beta-glucosidase [Atopobiaceae bacterium]MCI1432723.1 glucan 1,3-beta-glucosidase [Atopobiaceae bacterium]MCI1470940.1 glucan 1,3-beta-glucosidase [Atopobiaceae bacterium]